MTALSEQEIREMGLVEVTGPNSFGLGGVLLTVDYIERVIHGYGEIVRTWAVPPQTERYYMHDYGWLLGEGTMPIHFAERITLPENVMGYIHPLPSVIDCGVLMQPVHLWPGYDNRPETLITIAKGQRVILKKNARVAVATFHYVEGAETPQTRETENSVRRYASMVVEAARKLLRSAEWEYKPNFLAERMEAVYAVKCNDLNVLSTTVDLLDKALKEASETTTTQQSLHKGRGQ